MGEELRLKEDHELLPVTSAEISDWAFKDSQITEPQILNILLSLSLESLHYTLFFFKYWKR